MTTSAPPPHVLPWLVSLLAGPPALAALALAVLRPEDAPWELASSLLGVWGLLWLLARGAGPRRTRFVLAAVPLLLFAWPEMGLRVAGFRFDHALTVQFGFPDPELMVRLRQDPELFWKLPVGHPGANSEGFLGGEFTVPKPAGTYRVVFFGDSCTMQGYPALVEDELARDHSRRFETINFGVAGYTSHQGVVLAKRWADRLKTDLAVVYFGWNDHWLAYGAPDSQKTAPRWQRAVQSALRSTRVGQWFASLAAGGTATPLAVPRVSREEYAANLEQIGDVAEHAGAATLLLTAPTSMEELGVPGYLIGGFAADEQRVLEWHRAYNDIVRDVARRRGWHLLDLDAEMSGAEMVAMFNADRIHFSDAGLGWIAQRIAREIELLSRR